MRHLLRIRTLFVVALAAAALVVAGCGDDSDSDSGATTAATAPAGTIVDVASGNPDFSILTAAVTTAGLAETLSGPGPFTVFAPTNAAFEKALADLELTQEQLLASPDLAKILTYHVLPAKVAAADITEKQSPATVEGQPLDVAPSGGTVSVGPNATVVQADVPASNGVIHAIDAVLLPPDLDLG
jgi:uncharacterized surface protein with fasciclin (FAS1) repeats